MTVCSKCCVAPPRSGCREEADRRTMAPLSPARRDVINTAVRRNLRGYSVFSFNSQSKTVIYIYLVLISPQSAVA